jgi:hypothetical protein
MSISPENAVTYASIRVFEKTIHLFKGASPDFEYIQQLICLVIYISNPVQL